MDPQVQAAYIMAIATVITSIVTVVASIAIAFLTSLLTAIATSIITSKEYWRQTKEHPTQIIYNKQIEFFDRLAPLLPRMNSYITSIDVQLGESTQVAREQARHIAAKNQVLTEFYDLVDQYYMYLPEKLFSEATELFSECISLASSPTQEQTYDCIHRLFSFQNSIRKFVGIDPLSENLLKAFHKAA